MKRFTVLLAFAVVAFSLAGISHAIDTGNCADGTAYGHCSDKSPGNFCTGSLSSPSLGVLLTICPCSRTSGWVQEGEGDAAYCVQAKCTDGTQNGECSAATKPKQCVNGALVDNATKCGCPSGKRVAAGGVFCEFIPCTDGTMSVPEGTCSPKKATKCVNGQLVAKASECGCPTGQTQNGETCGIVCSDGTKDGQCSATLPKKCTNGYLLDAADSCGCPSGQTVVGKQCSTSVLGNLGGGADVLGGTSGNGTQAGTGGASPLSCCCLPTALIGIAGGFVFFRKKE
ncbi:Uncharacterised protein [uncultured archaeon]|nr:Uncharacterised protein [uncultured archaeon]